jgi:hypothetical protein
MRGFLVRKFRKNTKGMVLAGLTAVVGLGLAVVSVDADSRPLVEQRSGVGNDRTGNTVNGQGMMATPDKPWLPPNSDIAPLEPGSAVPGTQNRAPDDMQGFDAKSGATSHNMGQV